MPSVDAGGAELYYEEKGSGRTVLFVHGIPTDYRAWGAQVEPLAEGRRMVALSRRYAYPNKREGDVTDSTVQNNASDIFHFIQATGGGPVDLVGHSFGGFAAAVFAADHPEIVRSLVLVEPAVSTLLVADQSSGTQLLGLLLRSPRAALSGRRFQSGSLGPSLRALERGDLEEAVELNVDGVQDSRGAFTKFPEETRKMMLDNAKTIAELGVKFPRFTAAEAGRIMCPTLVINGGQSAPWLRRIGELMAKAVSGARVERVSGARHFPHMENADEFNRRVLGFLDQVR